MRCHKGYSHTEKHGEHIESHVCPFHVSLLGLLPTTPPALAVILMLKDGNEKDVGDISTV